ncbi:hypothetical protein COUCH_11505 [Couchioplanes caeruleus]|uniref:hypothetical protein n=1 Tax=Couchioplanes caeruleus TaxID=56438 RepID=UPI0020BEDE2F|nr:hypothetical protein [Couchioplanes caeruleus]UQU66848.1 hypothetical protein COUCH_11505 [Couchioplanes caeruleus]
MAVLVIASSIVPDRTAAVVLYAVAVVLTMPVGTGVVPALWVNTFAAVALGNVLGIFGASLDQLTQVGVVVTFVLMTVANAWIVRQLWQALRRRPGKG